MNLVSHVLKAHGGRTHWRTKKAFSAHISISGSLLPPPDRPPPGGAHYVAVGGYHLPTASRGRPTLRELVIEGDTRIPQLKIFGSTDVTRFGVYTPNRVEFRTTSNQLLEALDDPIEALAARPRDRPLRVIERIFLFGGIVWSSIATPFLLDAPDVSVTEKPVRDDSKTGRQLTVEFPETIEPLAPRRVLHVAEDGLIERHEYELRYLYPSLLADTASAHIAFDGIVVPTLRRVRPLKADDHSPALLDIEIFDIRFS